MAQAFRVFTQPSYEPIGLAETKTYLNVDYDIPKYDKLIAQLILSARSYAEQLMERALTPQTIETIETIARPTGGQLSGPINRGPNWYQYQEQLGANPFAAAMFYFDLPMPPCISITSIETRVTVWEPWIAFTGPTTLDNTPEPARLYFQVPPTVNQWRFRYVAGYNDERPLPHDLRQMLLEMVAFWFDNREGDSMNFTLAGCPLPAGLLKQLMSRRVGWQ